MLIRNISFCLLLTCVSFNVSFSQNCDNQRYRDSTFGVEKHSDIIFANVQALPAVYVSENLTISQNLFMDVFEPADDTLSKRPLVIFAFGGGFLIGGKDDEDAQAYCDSLARTGYVTASIQYRLGMNIASPESAVRAIYRAAQDYSAAIRYLKEYAEQYRIDTNYIFTGGVSAGSFSAMNMAYMQDADRPQETFASGGLTPAPDLGCINCSGNSYQHSTKAKALVNCWGAILDTSWVELNDNTPLISFHGDADPIVPFGTGYPFTALFLMPTVYGSQPIMQRANHINLTNRFHPFSGQGHNVWGTVVNNSFVGGPTPYLDTIITETKDFLYTFLQPQLPVITGSSALCAGDTIVYSVVQNAGSTYCWEIQGGMITSSDVNANQVVVLWQNVGTGYINVAETNYLHAMSDISSLAVDVSDCVTSVQSIADNYAFVIFPNPSYIGDEITISLSGINKANLRVTAMDGRVVKEQIINQSLSLNSTMLQKGIYSVMLYNEFGFMKTAKLVVN